jgi:starvation-inducible DNA-binding protein
VRKIGGTTLRSIAHISRLQRIQNRHAEHVPTIDMLAELVWRFRNSNHIWHSKNADFLGPKAGIPIERFHGIARLGSDNGRLVVWMREHDVCDEHGDVASASLLENWIDEADRRIWFLFEATRADGWRRSASEI